MSERRVPARLQVPVDAGFADRFAAFADVADEYGLPHSDVVKALIGRFVADGQLQQDVAAMCRQELATRRQAANRARSDSARRRHQTEQDEEETGRQ